MALTLVLWVLEIVGLTFWLGVKQGPDSYFYITIAQKGAYGDAYVDAHYTWYRSYIYLITFFFHQLRLGLAALVAFQVLVATSTLFVVYDLAKRISTHFIVPALALFFYVVWIKSHMWHFYIYTDSLFTSGSLWCIWLLLTRKTTWGTLTCLPLVLFVAFLRPVGITILIVYFFALIWPLLSRPWLYWILSLTVVVLGILLIAPHVLPTFELLDSYSKGEIVYGYDAWNIHPTRPLVLPLHPDNSLQSLSFFSTHNFSFFAPLTLLKAIALIVHTKPFYSWYHNLLIVAILFPAYSFFGSGFSFWEDKKAKVLAMVWLVSHVLIVAFTAEDWDGRFILPLLPIVWIGASVGIAYRNQKISPTSK